MNANPRTQEQLAESIASALHVLDIWNLEDAEVRGVLGFPFGAQMAEWKAGNLSSMPADVVRRLRHIGGIYGMLKGFREEAVPWLRTPNPHFGNQPPLARMASGNDADLIGVRDYLKSRGLFQARLAVLQRPASDNPN